LGKKISFLKNEKNFIKIFFLKKGGYISLSRIGWGWRVEDHQMNYY